MNKLLSRAQKATIAFSIALTAFVGCKQPDQAGPNDSWCTSGASVLTVNDGNVPSDVKARIYAASPGFTAVGNANYNANLPIVIIPFQFSTAFPFNSTVTTDVIRENFFQTGNGSVRDYFSENSWGQFNMREGWISNLVMLSLDSSDYIPASPFGDWTRNATLARDICQASSVNWAAIDADGNRTITRQEAQICFLIAAGGGGANRPSNVSITYNNLTYNIQASFVFFDCKKNDDPNKAVDALRYNYSTIWHEMAHGMFGLPDRYAAGTCGNGPAGQYDIMTDNCSWRHITIYDKMKLGWIQPRILVKPTARPDGERHCYSFPAIETTPAALILWDQNQPDEYWIIENKYKPASPRVFDRDLPESGLAIWWVDETKDSIYLVDARRTDRRPQLSFYPAGSDQRGALFKNRSGGRDSTFNLQFLLPGVNSPAMAIRAVSPEGNTMYAEF